MSITWGKNGFSGAMKSWWFRYYVGELVVLSIVVMFLVALWGTYK